MPSPDRRPSPRLPSAFTVAEALSAGETRAALRRCGLRAPFHGMRSTVSPPPRGAPASEAILRRAQDLLPRLGDGSDVVHAFSHVTALLLLECPIRCAPDLHVTTLAPVKPIRIAGVRGHATSEPFALVDRDSVPLIDPVVAFLQSASILPFTELVVAADHLVRTPRGRAERGPILELDELKRAATGSSQRGIRRARAALRHARAGSDSRMETLLRLLMARFGLDVLELQVEVYDLDGRWIGRFDMVDRERRLIIEYDGEQHRLDRAQYLRDERRLERVRSAGYRILRLHHEDVLQRPATTVRRIAEFLELPLREPAGATRKYFQER